MLLFASIPLFNRTTRICESDFANFDQRLVDFNTSAENATIELRSRFEHISAPLTVLSRHHGLYIHHCPLLF